jgi:hypothetical protein
MATMPADVKLCAAKAGASIRTVTVAGHGKEMYMGAPFSWVILTFA